MEKVLHPVIQNNMNIQRLLRIITSSLHAGLVLRNAVFQMLTLMLGISAFIAEILWLGSLLPHLSFCC
jgi:hypothetical protein